MVICGNKGVTGTEYNYYVITPLIGADGSTWDRNKRLGTLCGYIGAKGSKWKRKITGLGEVEWVEQNTISPSGVDFEVACYRGLGPYLAFSQVGPMEASGENAAGPTESLESVQDHDHASEHQGLEAQNRNAPQPEVNPFMQQFLEIMQRMAPQPQPQSQPQPQDAVIDKKYEIVRRQGAKVFAGTTDPPEAEEWLRNTERLLDRIECTPEQRLRYTVSLFEKDVLEWWETVPGSKNHPITLTWNDFLKEFADKYSPPVYRNHKKVEYLELKQNELSVAGYELQFGHKEVGIEAEEWVKLVGFLPCLRVEAGLLRSDLGEDRVQPDRSVGDLFLLMPIAVGDTLVNVGESIQLYVIVAVNQDVLSGIVLHGEIMPGDLRLQGGAVWEKIHNKLARVEGEVEVVEVAGIFLKHQQGKVVSLNHKQGYMQLRKNKLLQHLRRCTRRTYANFRNQFAGDALKRYFWQATKSNVAGFDFVKYKIKKLKHATYD
ncbi:UNVERIFIED_CONTAM: hypothetical protein Sradi_2060700 [Sesamum radiatum]|uniref:Retrotransposon gag domain-containing protein n=1 Tax=Sesamum radiatum TaxID=300843 RepID=A0AAW2THT8_SESRA